MNAAPSFAISSSNCKRLFSARRRESSICSAVTTYLRLGAIELAGFRRFEQVTQGLRRHAQFAGHRAHALPVLDSLHGGFLELCHVHLMRYP